MGLLWISCLWGIQKKAGFVRQPIDGAINYYTEKGMG